MIKSSLSVAMHTAIQAWCVKPASDDSPERQLAAHALAHGVSVSGLRVALRRASLLPPVNPRKPAAA